MCGGELRTVSSGCQWPVDRLSDSFRVCFLSFLLREFCLMKKFLLSLALVAFATPAWAGTTIAQWASNPIISGDKTYTLISQSGLDVAGVEASDSIPPAFGGLLHSLDINGLQNISGNFSLSFKVTINSGSNTIKSTRVSQNDILGNVTAGSTTLTNPGAFTDTLNGTQAGLTRAQGAGVTEVTFSTSTFGIASGNALSTLTYDVLQTPEPSTFALAGLAVAGLVFARRRAR